MGAEKDFVLATYLVHGAQDFHKKAESIAVGLTVGTWTRLPREKQEKMAAHLGKVFDVKELAPTKEGEPRALLTVGYPLANVTPDFPALLTTVFGKLSMDGKIKLVDLVLPDLLLKLFPGPRYGIEGVRRLLGVHDRPLLMSIFKQCIGLSLDELEDEYQQQLDGGVDLVKDDEIFFRDDQAPALERVRAFARRNLERERETGQKVLYAVNLTGPVTTIVEKARRLVEAGASCLLLNVAPYGLDVLHRLATDPSIDVPIMAHPAFSGALYVSSRYGVSAPLWLGKLLRWAGADIVLFPSPYGSVAMPQEEALQVADYLRDGSPHRPAFPAPSAGIHPGLVPVLYRDGIMKHFNPPGWEQIKDDILGQRISIREGVGRMFAFLPTSRKEEIVRFSLENAAIRPGFGEFVDYCRQHDIRLLVTSGGIDFFVYPVLSRFVIPERDIYCNGSDFSGETIRILWPHPCDEHCRLDCGMCKTTIIRSFPPDRYFRIVIGDSITDLAAAKLADLVIARDFLLQKCGEEGILHRPFETFFDCLALLEELTAHA